MHAHEPQGGPRWVQGSPTRPRDESMRTQDGSKRSPGAPPDLKKYENALNFNPKTDMFQLKEAGTSSSFLNMFGEKSTTPYKKHWSKTILPGEKGGHLFLFFTHVGEKNRGTVLKNCLHSVLFLNAARTSEAQCRFLHDLGPGPMPSYICI